MFAIIDNSTFTNDATFYISSNDARSASMDPIKLMYEGIPSLPMTLDQSEEEVTQIFKITDVIFLSCKDFLFILYYIICIILF